MNDMREEMRARALKVASADLTKEFGGIVDTAERLGKKKSVIGRNVNRNDAGCFFNIFDVSELERIAPKPFVTIEMARLAGGVFLKLPECELDAAGLREQVMALTIELGDVSARVSDALADEQVKLPEADAIEREANELIEKAVQLRAMARAMAESGHAPVKFAKAVNQ